MDLERFSVEELILAGIKSEIDSKKIYYMLANEIINPFLRDRLRFLGKEEESHKNYLENLYERRFPGKEIEVPKTTEVPIPDLGHFSVSETLPVSELLKRLKGTP